MSNGFTLRAPPFTGHGGLYVTGQGEGMPLIVARQGLEHQYWVQSQPNETGGDSAVAIFSKDDPELTWNFSKTSNSITLARTDEPCLWNISPLTDEDGQEIVHIIAKSSIVGAAQYAGVGDDNAVVIKAFPLFLGAEPRPVWQKRSEST